MLRVEYCQRNRDYELFGKELSAGEFANDLRTGINGSGQLNRLHSRSLTCEHMTLYYSSTICCQGHYSLAESDDGHKEWRGDVKRNALILSVLVDSNVTLSDVPVDFCSVAQKSSQQYVAYESDYILRRRYASQKEMVMLMVPSIGTSP